MTSKLFPCKKCIVKSICSEQCELAEQSPKKLFNIMFKQNRCPDCGDYYIIVPMNIEEIVCLNLYFKCFGCQRIYYISCGNLINACNLSTDSFLGRGYLQKMKNKQFFLDYFTPSTHYKKIHIKKFIDDELIPEISIRRLRKL